MSAAKCEAGPSPPSWLFALCILCQGCDETRTQGILGGSCLPAASLHTPQCPQVPALALQPVHICPTAGTTLPPRPAGGWRARDLCTPWFLCALQKAAEGKLRRSQKPPSASLFIHAGKAVYSVSGWKLHWDRGLIVLFVELIALFDRPFSHNAWELDVFAAM